MSALSETVNEAIGELARMHDEMREACDAREGEEMDVPVDFNTLDAWRATCGQLSDSLEASWES